MGAMGTAVRARATAIVVCALVLAAAATATSQAVNAPVDNTQVIYDVYGQRLDAHDGDLLQTPDGTIYLYGTSYGCGFQLNGPSPYCGVRVYTTRDLRTFTPAGALGGQYAFDHFDQAWQDRCTQPNFGCYRPHVVQRPYDGQYVMWVNTHGEEGYRILTSPAPGGPFTDTGAVPDLAVKPPVGGLRYGDMDLYVDTDGTGYVAYTAIWPEGNEHTIVIERLDPTLTTGTGEHVLIDAWPDRVDVIEAPALFKAPTGTWHLLYSNPARAYMPTATGIVNAPDALGPWTQPRDYTFNSCSGQPTGAWPITGPSGVTTWVYGTDRWAMSPTGYGYANQAKANNYYAPITFNANGGTAIDAGRCLSTWTLP